MPFDPAEFEANVALKLIPTEQLPAVAQDAMEAGFNGPHVVRMAILDPVAGWEVDQALPPMLVELECKAIPLKEAALRLARIRARHILDTNEDSLPSIPYFHQLMMAADHLDELMELGYLDDEEWFYAGGIEGKRACARKALEVLLTSAPDQN